MLKDELVVKDTYRAVISKTDINHVVIYSLENSHNLLNDKLNKFAN